MKVDEALLSALRAVMIFSSRGEQAGRTGKNSGSAQNSIPADSWTGVKLLFKSSLQQSLDSLMDFCRQHDLPEARAVTEIAFLFQKEIKKLPGLRQDPALALNRGLFLLRRLFLLKAVVLKLKESLSSAGKNARGIKILTEFCSECDQVEAREQLFQDQGFFSFPLPDPFFPGKDMELVFYRQESSQTQEEEKSCSFVLDLATFNLGKMTFFSQICKKEIGLRARVDDQRICKCLREALPGLKDKLKEQDFDLQSADIEIKGKHNFYSGEGLELVV